MIRYLLPLTIFLGITVLFIYGLQNDPRYIPSPLINQSAPEFNLPTLHEPELNIKMERTPSSSTFEQSLADGYTVKEAINKVL